MKKAALLVGGFLLVVAGFGQAGKKPAGKEKPPTQKEMADMMKKAQEALDGLSPSEKKLMDSLGIKIPGFSNVPAVGDAALAAAFADDAAVIPARKTQLINRLPRQILSREELMAFVRKTNAAIPALIRPASRQMAETLIRQFAGDPYYGFMIAAAANGMWTMGYREAATYLMGKAAEVLPNSDNLNNFAAYLTMGGAAHIAIPILDRINKVHPNNSTVLNNLGQAWLQLGEGATAEKYLDSAIRVYAMHPQANYTKCLLLKSRGKTAEAIHALRRSIQHGVTTTKLNLLKELEGSRYSPPRFFAPRVYYSTSFDLHKYVDMIPTAYAMKLGGDIENQWKAFREAIEEEQQRLARGIALVKSQAAEAEKAFYKSALAHGGNIYAPNHEKAVQRYHAFLKEYQRMEQKNTEERMADIRQSNEWQTKFRADYEKEQKRFEERVKNGANEQVDCQGLLPIINAYLEKSNRLNQQRNQKQVAYWLTQYYNLYYYWPSTANTDASAQAFVLSLRAGFLDKLKELNHETDLGYPCSDDGDKSEEYSKLKPLDDYDEVNCKVFNWIYTPGLGTIVMRCNTMSIHLNPVFTPFDASLRLNFDGFVEEASVGIEVKGVDIRAGAEFDEKGNFEKAEGEISTKIKGVKVGINGEIDQEGFKKGSVELGLDKSLKLLPKTMEEEAPVDIGLKNKLGVGMELSRNGDQLVADFVVKDKVELDLGSKVEVDNNVEVKPGMISRSGEVTDPEMVGINLPSAPSVSVSADNRYSVNSGYSAKGSSSFSKL